MTTKHKVTTLNRLCPLALAVAMIPTAAFAHHSTAAFDMQHPAMLTGTIKSFVWSNPHTEVVLMVPNAQGGADEWKLAGSSVVALVQQGFTPTMLKPGMKVRLQVAPRKDGTHAGEFMKILGIESGGQFQVPAAARSAAR